MAFPRDRGCTRSRLFGCCKVGIELIGSRGLQLELFLGINLLNGIERYSRLELLIRSIGKKRDTLL